MGKKAAKAVRMDWFKQMYSSFKAGYTSEESLLANIKLAGHVLSPKEVEKLLSENPDIDANDFNEFMVKVEGIKVGGRTVGAGRTSTLDSDEKVQQLGVEPDNVESYKSLIQLVREAKKDITKIISPSFRVSFSITRIKKVSDEQPSDSIPDEGPQDSVEPANGTESQQDVVDEVPEYKSAQSLT